MLGISKEPCSKNVRKIIKSRENVIRVEILEEFRFFQALKFCPSVCHKQLITG
jgi:hypothetical protein